MRQHRRYIEDPSIARCAALEFDRVWGLIERSTADGEWFFRAREVILAREIPDMQTAYGRAVASRVSIAIQCRGPEDLSPEAKRAVRDRMRDLLMAEHARRRGGIGIINRISFQLTGTAFW
jgi:hypothetical protein